MHTHDEHCDHTHHDCHGHHHHHHHHADDMKGAKLLWATFLNFSITIVFYDKVQCCIAWNLLVYEFLYASSSGPGVVRAVFARLPFL